VKGNRDVKASNVVIGWKLEPKEEDFLPAVVRALKQLNAADSELERSGC